LERASRLRPKDPTAMFGLAGAKMSLGQTEEARELLEQVVSAVPDFTEAHVLLATTYYRLKRTEDGDRHRAIADRLRLERQEREPRPADPTLGPPSPGGRER